MLGNFSKDLNKALRLSKEEANSLQALSSRWALSVGVLLAEDALFNARLNNVDPRAAKSGLEARMREILKKDSKMKDNKKSCLALSILKKKKDDKRPRPPPPSLKKKAKFGPRSSPLMEKIEEMPAPREVELEKEQSDLQLVRFRPQRYGPRSRRAIVR